jgi:protein TonB
MSIRRPNWILRGFIIVSSIVHLVLLLHVSGLVTVTQYEKIKVALRENEPQRRTMPRPRPKPPEPLDMGQLKPLEPARPIMPVPSQPQQAEVDTRIKVDSYAFGDAIALPSGGLVAPALPAGYSAPKIADSGMDQEQRSLYQEMVRLRIEKEKQYPVASRKRHEEGRTLVHFAISERGELRDARVVKSSRNKELDDAALDAVRRAAPYPPPPPALGKKGVAMEITIAFELH